MCVCPEQTEEEEGRGGGAAGRGCRTNHPGRWSTLTRESVRRREERGEQSEKISECQLFSVFPRREKREIERHGQIPPPPGNQQG